MSSQTVFRLTSRNGFDGLKSFDEPIPTISKYEVLIKVRSVALNYRDIAIATSTYPLPVKDDVVPCSDFSGEVVKVGDAVSGLKPGDPVTASSTPDLIYGPAKESYKSLAGPIDGVLREYIALPEHVVVKVPESKLSFTQWASLITTGLTAWNALFGYTPLKPGQTVLILGTGGVSLTALILAKAAGAKVIITSSSDEKLAQVKADFGADHTINYKTAPNWAAEVLRITNGEGVDNVIENGGLGTIEQSLDSAAWGGRVSLIGFLSNTEKVPDVTMKVLIKGIALQGIRAGTKEQLDDFVKFFAGHDLAVPVDKVFGFTREEVVSAFEYVASGKQVGKVCINLD